MSALVDIYLSTCFRAPNHPERLCTRTTIDSGMGRLWYGLAGHGSLSRAKHVADCSTRHSRIPERDSWSQRSSGMSTPADQTTFWNGTVGASSSGTGSRMLKKDSKVLLFMNTCLKGRWIVRYKQFHHYTVLKDEIMKTSKKKSLEMENIVLSPSHFFGRLWWIFHELKTLFVYLKQL